MITRRMTHFYIVTYNFTGWLYVWWRDRKLFEGALLSVTKHVSVVSANGPLSVLSHATKLCIAFWFCFHHSVCVVNLYVNVVHLLSHAMFVCSSFHFVLILFSSFSIFFGPYCWHQYVDLFIQKSAHHTNMHTITFFTFLQICIIMFGCSFHVVIFNWGFSDKLTHSRTKLNSWS